MTDSNLNICKSLKSLTIVKFIIKSINIDDLDTKIIFIGKYNDNIKKIIKKLESKNTKDIKNVKDTNILNYEMNYESNYEINNNIKDNEKYIKSILSEKEINELESIIPHFTIKIGNIKSYNTHFIYQYIESNLSIEHIKIIIYETLKTHIYKSSSISNLQKYLPLNILIYKYSKLLKKYIKSLFHI